MQHFRIRPMTISSVTSSVPSPTPVISPQTSAPPAPPVQNDGDSDDGSSQATQAPLPPGQGTRVDQLA
jgi:hypothetical protein